MSQPFEIFFHCVSLSWLLNDNFLSFESLERLIPRFFAGIETVFELSALWVSVLLPLCFIRNHGRRLLAPLLQFYLYYV